MNKPDYIAPKTLNDAFKALTSKKKGVKIIAGGTDLVPRMRAGVTKPELLVDLRLLNLNQIKEEDDHYLIGAGITHSEIIESKIIQEHFPALVESGKDIAGPPIRNRGTLGGNLVNASPAADLATPLIVYDAQAVIANDKGERIVSLAEFFTGPGQTVLKEGDILTDLKIPKMPARTGAKFIKLGKRKAMAIAVVSVAVRLTLDEQGEIKEARIALGSVAPVPFRANKAEKILEGKTPDEELFIKAGKTASDEINPISDLRSTAEYRKEMGSVLTRRALQAASDQLNEDR